MFNADAKIEYADWVIGGFLGNGASARVYRAEKDGQSAALKIFDPEIFSGDAEAKERLARQAELVTRHHPNLADTLEVGNGKINGAEAPALLMEFCAGESLDKPFIKPELSEVRVRSIISAVAHAAKYLMNQGYVHRDIKPANVMHDLATGATKLLDTGVIRPLNNPNDVSGYAFVGTKRYSPPEFLYRREDGTAECWDAITLYQLGATLYELLLKRQPYSQYHVQAQLVRAIEVEDPDFSGSETLPSDLRHLLHCSLKRDWRTRLRLVSWDDFLGIKTPHIAPKRIDEQAAATLILPTPKVELRRLDEINRTVTRMVEQIRQPLIAKKILVKVQKIENGTEVAAGRSIRDLKAVQRVQLFACDGAALIAKITSVPELNAEHFLVAPTDEAMLCEEIRRRLEASL